METNNDYNKLVEEVKKFNLKYYEFDDFLKSINYWVEAYRLNIEVTKDRLIKRKAEAINAANKRRKEIENILIIKDRYIEEYEKWELKETEIPRRLVDILKLNYIDTLGELALLEKEDFEKFGITNDSMYYIIRVLMQYGFICKAYYNSDMVRLYYYDKHELDDVVLSKYKK